MISIDFQTTNLHTHPRMIYLHIDIHPHEIKNTRIMIHMDFINMNTHKDMYT
jgi:hypothetical protein